MPDKPLTKGEQTRERLLALAEEAVLQKGFASTSIEELIAAAGITKSGFFYHFRDKNDLAKALLRRYLVRDDEIFDGLTRQAEALSDDPLHAYLIFLKLLADLMGDLPRGHPGCLVASYCYQDQLFSQDVRDLSQQGMLSWRVRFRAWLDRIVARYPLRSELDLDATADMLGSIIDGGIILSKVLHDPTLLPRQLLLYRAFVRAVFSAA